MEYVILGLLILKSQTIYELNKHFETSISLFYSASYGSLRTTTNKLLKKGLIHFEERKENGRNKKIYTILDEGKEEFFKWMYSEVSQSKLEVEALTKLFFLGLVESNENKKAILKNIIETTDVEKDNLENLEESIKEEKIPDGYEDIAYYRLKTLNYGIQSCNFSKDMFEDILKELEESK
ncbi:putative transcriptional regulator [Gottschalkia acidurici 9a]|uniref:Transcriptional regulator n=1 Tax=Gottschalkia acidurici (strain ATCC 7906 / DSM 604 / BCRC 14475 / CIP 104303 / KCTC 5404 / NCIMB 10678 / 9a) TaxID=1128398 RepID=K0AZP4_GOTA9|nr:PadR family transcriptional regulator [Gottschalkia acidurici]AFS77831.1 putative transcriptional regulator [Gottschalkia acidurici 9a]